MVSGKHKARTLRRVYRKTPGGRVVMHFLKRKPSKAHCADCGMVLAGVPAARKIIFQNLAKTRKRPERAFGGVLCSNCSRRTIIERARH